jgi:putative PIN family toxin of toxin-antitoxin system
MPVFQSREATFYRGGPAGTYHLAVTAPLDLVLDTNIALDLIVFDDPSTQQLATLLASGALRWLVTDGIRAEFERVLRYPTLKLSAANIGLASERFVQLSTSVPSPPPSPTLPQCRDPDDQPFVDLAVAHSARLLLSRDRAVLELAPRLRQRCPGLTVGKLADPAVTRIFAAESVLSRPPGD